MRKQQTRLTKSRLKKELKGARLGFESAFFLKYLLTHKEIVLEYDGRIGSFRDRKAWRVIRGDRDVFGGWVFVRCFSLRGFYDACLVLDCEEISEDVSRVTCSIPDEPQALRKGLGLLFHLRLAEEGVALDEFKALIRKYCEEEIIGHQRTAQSGRPSDCIGGCGVRCWLAGSGLTNG